MHTIQARIPRQGRTDLVVYLPDTEQDRQFVREEWPNATFEPAPTNYRDIIVPGEEN